MDAKKYWEGLERQSLIVRDWYRSIGLLNLLTAKLLVFRFWVPIFKNCSFSEPRFKRGTNSPPFLRIICINSEIKWDLFCIEDVIHFISLFYYLLFRFIYFYEQFTENLKVYFTKDLMLIFILYNYTVTTLRYMFRMFDTTDTINLKLQST